MIKKYHYIILSFFLTRVLFLGGGYTVLLNIGRNNSILCGLLGMLLGYFILYLLYKKDSINQYICVLISLGVLLINILSNTVLTSTYLLYNTPPLIIMGIFIIVLLWASLKDFKMILRFSLISICLAIPIILSIYIGLFPITKVENIKPFFDTSYYNLVKGILLFMVTSLLPNILLLNYKDNLKYKDISKGYIIGCLSDIYIIYLIISMYGIDFATIIRFPEYLILKKFSILNYISNVENILIMIWIFNLLLSGWICLKVLRDVLDKKLLNVIIVIFILGIEIFLNRHYANILFIRNYIYIGWGFLIILSLVFKKNKN